jgi:hypothetical protein
MRKLKLKVESLDVETFEMRREMEGEGTVRGLAATAFACSYSQDLKCFAPQTTITEDPVRAECNTNACGEGGVSQLGCGTDYFCV